jgi:hypothetical protein
MLLRYNEIKKENTMKNSVHEKNIHDDNLGLISPFQQKILESFNLDKEIFALELKDPATNKVYIFDRWILTNGEKDLYQYMRDKNISMDELEKKYLQMDQKNSIYDVNKEGTGI